MNGSTGVGHCVPERFPHQDRGRYPDGGPQGRPGGAASLPASGGPGPSRPTDTFPTPTGTGAAATVNPSNGLNAAANQLGPLPQQRRLRGTLLGRRLLEAEG